MLRASTADEHDLFPGSLLGGKYRVHGVLGRGGTGHVYEAVQDPIGRPVAVKVLRPDLPPDEQWQFEARFLREASRAGALQHPNVVTVHDFGRTDDGTCYIVMELLRGRALKELLREGPVPIDRALDIFDQLLRGLRAAHQSGLVHRDIKPGNIMLMAGDEGRDFVKILDFGLVKDSAIDLLEHASRDDGDESLAPDDSSDSVVTRHGAFLGTPHYIAPEQARGNAVDGRADLYSAGVVLYRMLTGALPFYDRNPTTLALMHVNDPYPPMASRASNAIVPAAVEAMVRRCMEKRPEDRFDDADALLLELAAVRRSLAMQVQPVPVVISVPPPAPRARAAIAGIGALLLAIGVAAWMSLPPADSDTVHLSPSAAELPVAEPAPQPVAEPVAVAPVAVEPVEPVAPVPTTAHHSAKSTSKSTAKTQDKATEKPAEKAAKAEPATSPPVKTQTTSPPTTSSGPVAVRADGVSFTAAEAAAATKWLNSASEDQVRAAGVAPQQVKIVLEGRPWTDVAAFAATFNIGPKTVEAVHSAVQ